jgi:hypothetical protein
MFTDARTTNSDAFFRFIVAAKAAVLPTPVNLQQLSHQPRTNCQRYNRDLQPTLTPILNDCAGNMMETTRRYDKVVGVVRRAIEESMAERLLSKIGENTVIRK